MRKQRQKNLIAREIVQQGAEFPYDVGSRAGTVKALKSEIVGRKAEEIIMKRILSLVVAVIMLVSCTAYAAGDLSFLAERPTAAECSFECSFKLNKPLDFIGELPLGVSNEWFDGASDLCGLVESLFDSATKGTMKLNASKDFKKLSFALETENTVPARFNQNLLVTMNAKSGMWLELDFSDAKNPVYSIVLRTPLSDKYITADIVDMIKSKPNGEAELARMIKLYGILTEEFTASALNNASVKLIEDCAKVSRRGNNVTVTFDDSGFKKYIVQTVGVIGEFAATVSELSSQPETSGDTVLASVGFEFDAETAAKALEGIGILGKDGLVISYGLSGGRIAKVESNMHISLNLGAVLRAVFGEVAEETDECPAADIDFTVCTAENYRNVNGNVKVTKPILNEENSVSFNALTSRPQTEFGEDPADFESGLEFFGVYTTEFIPLGVDNAYIGVRELFESAGEDFDIFYSDGTVSVNMQSDGLGFDKAVFRVGESTATVDGMELALENPVILRDGRVYVDTSFVLAVLNFDTEEICYYPTTGELIMGFSKRAW